MGRKLWQCLGGRGELIQQPGMGLRETLGEQLRPAALLGDKTLKLQLPRGLQELVKPSFQGAELTSCLPVRNKFS